MSPSNLDDFWSSIDEIILNYRNQIQGVAFSSPGRVDVDKGIIYLGGALTYLDDVHVKERIKQRYNLTAAVVNDGKAAALAEVWQGSLKGGVRRCYDCLGDWCWWRSDSRWEIA